MVKNKSITIGEKDYTPRSKAQRELMKADMEGIREVTLGGAGGTGKTIALLISSLGPQESGKFLVDDPDYRAFIFRREAAQLEKTNLISSAQTWYSNFYSKVQYNGSLKRFTFPSGATISFTGCESEDDAYKFKGHTKLHFVGFEELTQFTERQFELISTRLRDINNNIPLRVRATTNPGDIHEEWVLNRYKYWLTNSCEFPLDTPIKAKYAQRLWMYVDEESPDYPIVITDKNPKRGEKFVFIETFASDILADNIQNMGRISDPVQRKQLLEGRWGLRSGAGLYFKEKDFILTEKAPPYCTRVRYWDMAASGQKGDFCAGALVSHYIERGESKYCIEDIILCKPEPSDLEKLILRTAKADGKGVFIGMEQEAASSGKVMSGIWKDKLKDYRVKIDAKRVSKTHRASIASPLSAQGKISYLANTCTNEMFKQLVNFPTKGVHDDAVDSITGALYLLIEELPKPNTGPVYPKFIDKKDVYTRLQELRTTPSVFR